MDYDVCYSFQLHSPLTLHSVFHLHLNSFGNRFGNCGLSDYVPASIFPVNSVALIKFNQDQYEVEFR